MTPSKMDGVHRTLSKAFCAPAAAAFLARSSMYELDSTITGSFASSGCERTNLSTSPPVSLGIIKSSTIRSGLPVRRAFDAASPS